MNTSVNNTINEYMPLVKSVAKKWTKVLEKEYTKQDLISHGMEALWRCTKPGKYDPECGVTFGQYAKKAIQNEYGQLLAKGKYKGRFTKRLQSTTFVSSDEDDDLDELRATVVNCDNVIGLVNACQSLTHQEALVINRLYYDGYDGNEVGKELGISRQMVANIKNQALDKLKRKLSR